MSTRHLPVLLGAFLLAGACLLSCGRSDLVDSVDDATGIAVATAGVGGTGGAGGSGGAAPDLNGLCTRACKKIVACAPGTITQTVCVSQCVLSGMQTCPNFSDIFSMTDQCLSRTSCVDFETCLQVIPPCEGSGSTTRPGTTRPGTTTPGATTGSCVAVCTRAVTCCKAISPTSDCSVLATACGTSDPAQTETVCQSVLTAGATIPQGAPFCR